MALLLASVCSLELTSCLIASIEEPPPMISVSGFYLNHVFPREKKMSVWQKEWAEEQWKSQDKGIWIIGILLKPRFHTVTTTSSMHRYTKTTDSSTYHLRFAACPINVEFAFARTWNNWGNELQPDLRHPDRTKDMEMLSQDQIQNIVKMPEGLLPDDLLAALHPNKPGRCNHILCSDTLDVSDALVQFCRFHLHFSFLSCF